MSEHVPVLVDQVLGCFEQKKLRVFFDGTLGLGGHAEAILKAHPEIEIYVGLDQDKEALQLAERHLQQWKDKVKFVHRNFSEIDRVLQELRIEKVDGFLCDIGVSSMQLEEGRRGFSFSKEGPLDMRMDQTKGISAKKVINTFSEKELGSLIKEFGEERHWRAMARLIVERRAEKPFETTEDLASFIAKNFRKTKQHLHPATLVFQALRIYVNQELQSLKEFLAKAVKVLTVDGIGAIISFHSLEDRIVKEFIKDQTIKDPVTGQKQEKLKSLTKKPLVAEEKEIQINPRSRSAKLRAFKLLGSVC